MKNKRNKLVYRLLVTVTLVTTFFSCKKVDQEIERQNGGSGIMSFSPTRALLGDTVLVYIKNGAKDNNASLRIGNKEVQVLEKKPGVTEGQHVETWKIIIPRNAPFGEPSAELTVLGQRMPAFYGISLTAPPELVEGKVTVSLVAGTYREKEYGDCGEIIYPAKDGAALEAQFGQTGLIACSKTGSAIYVVERYDFYDCNNPGVPDTKVLVRKIENGAVTTIAGGGTDPEGNGLSAKLPENVRGLAVHPNGKLYVSAVDLDEYFTLVRSRIISIDPVTGEVKTIAGGQRENADYSGKIKDGPALQAKLFEPGDMAFDGNGNLYFLDLSGFCIRKLDTSGEVTTLFGATKKVEVGGEEYMTRDTERYGHEDGFGSAEAVFGKMTGIATAGNGKIYVVDNGGGKYGSNIREISPANMEVATIIGLPLGVRGKETGSFKEVTGKPDGTDGYYGMDADFDGNLLVTVQGYSYEMRLLKVDLQFETVKLIAGGGYQTDPTKPLPGHQSRLFGETIAFDEKGVLYIGDNQQLIIRKIEREL